VVQGEAVGDGGLVAADTAGERVQVRQVAGVDGGDPAGQVLAVAAGHHLGERGDVPGGGAQLRAAGFDPAGLGGLVVGEVIGAAGDPPGHLPDGERWRREHRGGERRARRLQVTAR
jgi:hypothetical protein